MGGVATIRRTQAPGADGVNSSVSWLRVTPVILVNIQFHKLLKIKDLGVFFLDPLRETGYRTLTDVRKWLKEKYAYDAAG